MVADYRLMVGFLDQGRSFDQLVELIAKMTAATLRDVPGETESVVGRIGAGYVWVQFDPADFEPFASHPYGVDLRLEDPSREPELANHILTALVATGGYQVILLMDGDPIRSSHYTEADLDAEIGELGRSA
ncbi:hypothetical protein ACIBF5_22650 [Micromonospora sp. NPDC050417]|uniref:hypothetical protein n=1 Tax=Micromonospora sp. NPDC050417 TaxID=3364280 RepID=UPI003793EEDE